MDNKMTPAELAAMRRNQGKSTEELLREQKEKEIRKKMQGMTMAMEIGETPASISMTPESQQMMQDTEEGYQATKKKPFKSGGKVKKYAKGGSVSSASKRADGCATKGKTKGRMR